MRIPFPHFRYLKCLVKPWPHHRDRSVISSQVFRLEPGDFKPGFFDRWWLLRLLPGSLSGEIVFKVFCDRNLGESYEAERFFFEKNIVFAKARFFLRKTFFFEWIWKIFVWETFYYAQSLLFFEKKNQQHFSPNQSYPLGNEKTFPPDIKTEHRLDIRYTLIVWQFAPEKFLSQ